MDQFGSRRRHVASIHGDDTQGWTQGFLGLRGTTPRTGNQKEVLTPKSQKSTYKHYKTGEKPLRNRRHTQGADSKYHRRSRQDKFRQAAKSAFDQRYNKQQKQTQNSPRNVKIWTQKSDENDARRARRIVEDASGSGPDGSPVRPVKSTQLRSRASAPKTVKNTGGVSRNLQVTTVTTNFGVAEDRPTQSNRISKFLRGRGQADLTRPATRCFSSR